MVNGVVYCIKGRFYARSDCNKPVRSVEIADLTAAERRTLRDGSYLCDACREERRLTDI